MRACGRCGHSNADHLNYCFNCGRRLDRGRGTGAGTPSGGANYAAPRAASNQAATAFALTVALTPRQDAAVTTSAAAAHPPGQRRAGLLARGWEAVRYLFVYVRGRLDAQDRKRDLMGERESAHRQIESVLFGLGKIVIAEGHTTPELADLVETMTQARARREAAVADLATAEKLQASDDLRMGLEQSRAESEWKACEAGAVELDRSLRKLEEERARGDDQLRRLDAAAALGPLVDKQRQDADRAALDEQYQALRERAAGLRASTVAARAKFDLATAARRQAATARTASLSAHARDRAEAEKTIHDLTVQIGRTTAGLHLPRPSLLPEYAHIARLEAGIEDRDAQITRLQRTIGGYDARKLAAGICLLMVAAMMLSAAAWLLLF